MNIITFILIEIKKIGKRVVIKIETVIIIKEVEVVRGVKKIKIIKTRITRIKMIRKMLSLLLKLSPQ